MSMLSSPDFRLPRNVTPHMMFPDQLSTGSTHFSSLTDSSERVSTRIPEISILGTFRRRRTTCHHTRLDINFLLRITLRLCSLISKM